MSKCILELMVGMLWFGDEGSSTENKNDPITNLIELGFSFYQNGKNKDALNYFKQALQVKKRADIYNNIGFVYTHDGKYAKAFNAFRQALHIDGGYLPAFYNLGIVLYYGKSFQDSINIFIDILQIPELDKTMRMHAQNDIGCAYKRAGNVPAAIKAFEAAITIDETFERPYNNLGNMYCEQGNFEEAIKKYKKALQLNKNCGAAYNGLGAICAEKGEFEKAIVYFDKAIDKQGSAAYINKIIVEKKREKSNS